MNYEKNSLQEEKRQKSANPGFEGIKKWLEVFMLSPDGGLAMWWAPAEKSDSFGANLQLSSLIKVELEKFKNVYWN